MKIMWNVTSISGWCSSWVEASREALISMPYISGLGLAIQHGCIFGVIKSTPCLELSVVIFTFHHRYHHWNHEFLILVPCVHELSHQSLCILCHVTEKTRNHEFVAGVEKTTKISRVKHRVIGREKMLSGHENHVKNVNVFFDIFMCE